MRLAGNIVIAAAPLLLFFLPIGWLQGEHTLCLFTNIFGVECWGCGITRAVVSAVQLHWRDAWEYNRLIVIVFPLLVYVWARTVIKLWRMFGKKKNCRYLCPPV
jgi:hypothetical protein